jgi:hypothetical protein
MKKNEGASEKQFIGSAILAREQVRRNSQRGEMLAWQTRRSSMEQSIRRLGNTQESDYGVCVHPSTRADGLNNWQFKLDT